MVFPSKNLRSLNSLAEKFEKNRLLLLAGFTAVYLVVTYVLSKRKLMNHDEIYTYYISLLPTMTDVWAALMTGGEILPPFFYAVTRASISLFGVNNVAFRLPEMIGFWVMCVCVFIFVARRTSNFYGLLAAIFLLLTSGYYYAYEARPYGLVLGFAALALLCWQSAAMNRFRSLSIVCVALSLGGAVASHYYGILVIFPIALGEAVRTLTRKRLDALVWAALVLAVAPLFWCLPLMKQASAYSTGFFRVPQWVEIPEFYYEFLATLAIPLTATLFLAGIYLALYQSDEAREQNAENGFTPPVYEVAAACGFFLIPVICVITAKLVTGAFLGRYAIPIIIGFSILLTFAAAKLYKNTALPAAALIIFYAGWFGFLQYKAIKQVAANPVNRAVKMIQSENENNLPVIVAEPQTLAELVRYGPPEITSRLLYLADPEASLRHLNHNSLERSTINTLKPVAKLNTADYKTYMASRQRFLVYGKLGHFNWIIPQLKEDKMLVELRANEGDRFLFLVSPKE